MDRGEWKRLAQGQQSAARRARAVRAAEGAPPPSEAFERAMALWELRPELFAMPRTAREEREIARVRDAWARVKAPWVR